MTFAEKLVELESESRIANLRGDRERESILDAAIERLVFEKYRKLTPHEIEFFFSGLIPYDRSLYDMMQR